ncbi:hypothetical protein BDZ45DRAFT_754919 [Acephala macrosclerotiorum]|nr:hypothetical protein BDZ45DRAFT_754919 [Acephala macrosclerotiorum]
MYLTRLSPKVAIWSIAVLLATSSIFLWIGSPAWISSSVLLAILYRRSVRTRFHRLEAKLRSPPTGTIFLHVAERCEAASTILQSFIQAPIRLSPREGVLSSLITLNHWWWVAAAVEIEALWRRIDAIFIAQTFIAALAWVLAIISDFWSIPGLASSSNSVEWQICMGTLWLWVFTATFGPVAIKSLYKANAMRDVLLSPRGLHGKLHVVLDDGSIAEQYVQRAIVQKSGLNPKYPINRRRQSTKYHEIKNEDKEAIKKVLIPETLGSSIEGDGETEGVNAFPYRFLPSEHTSNLIIGGFESLHDRLEQNRIPDADQDETEIFQPGGSDTVTYSSNLGSLELGNGLPSNTKSAVRPIRTWNSELPPERNFEAKSGALDLYLRIDVARITAYPEWKEIGRHQWVRLILANIFGLVVQWGTTGPAIWVMYWSPPVGLGCDSGGLLIYGVGATLSWLLLTLGSLVNLSDIFDGLDGLIFEDLARCGDIISIAVLTQH